MKTVLIDKVNSGGKKTGVNAYSREILSKELWKDFLRGKIFKEYNRRKYYAIVNDKLI